MRIIVLVLVLGLFSTGGLIAAEGFDIPVNHTDKVEFQLASNLEWDGEKCNSNSETTAILYLEEQPSESQMQSLIGDGVTIETSTGNLVQIKLSCRTVERIIERDFVNFISSPPKYSFLDELSEGSEVIRAIEAQGKGVTGAGVKVAVIDAGFDLDNPEISDNIQDYGTFGPIFNIEGDSISDKNHGTAVAEIIVDIAPEVELYLYNFETNVEFVNAIDFVSETLKVDIIAISVGFFGFPGDGTGEIAEAIDRARERGSLGRGHRQRPGNFRLHQYLPNRYHSRR